MLSVFLDDRTSLIYAMKKNLYKEKDLPLIVHLDESLPNVIFNKLNV